MNTDFAKAYEILDKVAYLPAEIVVHRAFDGHIPVRKIDKLSDKLDRGFREAQSRYHAIIRFMQTLDETDSMVFTSYLNSLT